MMTSSMSTLDSTFTSVATLANRKPNPIPHPHPDPNPNPHPNPEPTALT